MNGSMLLDSTPLFGVPTECSVDISDIDAILISNSLSMLALPFFTEHPDFNGCVYATEPTANIGKFFMEELVEFIERVPRDKIKLSDGGETEWPADVNIFKLLNPSLNFPVKLTSSNFDKNLKELYSKKSINDALVKVRLVGFSENIVSLTSQYFVMVFAAGLY